MPDHMPKMSVDGKANRCDEHNLLLIIIKLSQRHPFFDKFVFDHQSKKHLAKDGFQCACSFTDNGKFAAALSLLITARCKLDSLQEIEIKKERGNREEKEREKVTERGGEKKREREEGKDNRHLTPVRYFAILKK